MNPDAILCEFCGYPLSGSGQDRPDGVCPECGVAAALSLPDRRVGSPIQREWSTRAWWATGVAALTRPRELAGEVRVEWRESQRLLVLNCLVASACVVVPWVLFLAVLKFAWGRGGRMFLEAGLLGIAVAMPVIALLLLTLSWIETRGIRFFGRRRGWRVSKNVAMTVVAHASYGWVAGALLLGAQAMVPHWVAFDGQTSHWPSWLSAVWPTWLSPLPALAMLAAVLWFEILVAIGVRRMRFANAPAPDGASPTVPNAGESPQPPARDPA